ncbi:hypothetical protein Rmf_08550 [Roseomonas fluvialis]|uniref:Uncharacterized protein n=1 Tax=Roseomonas fluvialis TaxID=1750527 RepID=A0ABN6NY34_9PROT|nr:hypothetical protein Rmf_08550 [Roseomonas fluvialis]
MRRASLAGRARIAAWAARAGLAEASGVGAMLAKGAPGAASGGGAAIEAGGAVSNRAGRVAPMRQAVVRCAAANKNGSRSNPGARLRDRAQTTSGPRRTSPRREGKPAGRPAPAVRGIKNDS